MINLPEMTVPLVTDEKGVIRVAGTRIPIDTVIACYHQGDTPERIHSGFDTLSVPTIYAVIAYYLAHQEEIDAYLAARDEEGDQLRRETEANYPPELKARLAELRKLARQKQDKAS